MFYAHVQLKHTQRGRPRFKGRHLHMHGRNPEDEANGGTFLLFLSYNSDVQCT